MYNTCAKRPLYRTKRQFWMFQNLLESYSGQSYHCTSYWMPRRRALFCGCSANLLASVVLAGWTLLCQDAKMVLAKICTASKAERFQVQDWQYQPSEHCGVCVLCAFPTSTFLNTCVWNSVLQLFVVNKPRMQPCTRHVSTVIIESILVGDKWGVSWEGHLVPLISICFCVQRSNFLSSCAHKNCAYRQCWAFDSLLSWKKKQCSNIWCAHGPCVTSMFWA